MTERGQSLSDRTESGDPTQQVPQRWRAWQEDCVVSAPGSPDGGKVSAEKTLRLTDEGLELPEWFRGYTGRFTVKTSTLSCTVSTGNAPVPDDELWDGPIAAVPQDEENCCSRIPSGCLVLTAPGKLERCYRIVDKRSPCSSGGVIR